MAVACEQGHTESTQLLSSYGAQRTNQRYGSAEDVCTNAGHDELAAWLRLSRAWTPLHHLEVLTPARARALLRDGADPHAKPTTGGGVTSPSPLERANARDSVGSDEVRRLLQRSALAWSPATHELFPAAARARAVELFWLGQRLAIQPRFETEAQAVLDCWDGVLVHAVTRLCKEAR